METVGQKTISGTNRLYRAQRLHVQLLPKSMLLAILIGNGIRLQSIIALCPEKFFSCRILQDTKVNVHYFKILRAQRLYVHFVKILRAQRFYVHICALRESADMLLLMT